MNRFTLVLLGTALLSVLSCHHTEDISALTDKALDVSGVQLKSFAEYFDTTDVTARSWKDGEYHLIAPKDWTSGFFPGELWLYYEMTGNEEYRRMAEKYTARLSEVPYMTNTHDLGFMIYCSYGHQWLNGKDSISAAAIVQASKSLISRFDKNIGLIRSWDFREWNYPVIIDNMMNLEMLFWASEYTGDPVYKDIAIKHADKTLANHFREDGSSYHVVSYNNDGAVESRGTYQGYSDDSDWARGQAWGLYGYTVCYRYTHDKRYIAQAERIAKLIMTEETTPADCIPYWDYKAPGALAAADGTDPDSLDSLEVKRGNGGLEYTPRDASAAAVTASALLELSQYAHDGKRYSSYAVGILKSLSSPEYLSEPGENGFFILKHSTGAAPFGSEVDVPINYADYYFLEALQRYRKIVK